MKKKKMRKLIRRARQNFVPGSTARVLRMMWTGDASVIGFNFAWARGHKGRVKCARMLREALSKAEARVAGRG